MINTTPSPDARERFDHLYGTVTAQRQTLVVADARAGAPEDISLAAAKDIGPDNLKHLGYRALSMLTQRRINDSEVGIVGKTRETIELYEDPRGELTACFGDGAVVTSLGVGRGTFYGYPHREYAIPAHSAAIAVNSALLAMELALLDKKG